MFKGRYQGREFDVGPTTYNGHLFYKNYPGILIERRNRPSDLMLVLEDPNHVPGKRPKMVRIKIHSGSCIRTIGKDAFARFDVLLLDDKYPTYTTVMNPDTLVVTDIRTGKYISAEDAMKCMELSSREFEEMAWKGDFGAPWKIMTRFKPDYYPENYQGDAYDYGLKWDDPLRKDTDYGFNVEDEF